MRELIAELTAFLISIPAISIILPLLSVLAFWAIFHWAFVPDKKPARPQARLSTQGGILAATAQQTVATANSATAVRITQLHAVDANATLQDHTDRLTKADQQTSQTAVRGDGPASTAAAKANTDIDSPQKDSSAQSANADKTAAPRKSNQTDSSTITINATAANVKANRASPAIKRDLPVQPLPGQSLSGQSLSDQSPQENAPRPIDTARVVSDNKTAASAANAKSGTTQASKVKAGNKDNEEVKYQTAAKMKQISSSVEAMLHLRTPVSRKPITERDSDSTATSTGKDTQTSQLLVDKNRRIKELEQQLAALQKNQQPDQPGRNGIAPAAGSAPNQIASKTANQASGTDKKSQAPTDKARAKTAQTDTAQRDSVADNSQNKNAKDSFNSEQNIRDAAAKQVNNISAATTATGQSSLTINSGSTSQTTPDASAKQASTTSVTTAATTQPSGTTSSNSASPIITPEAAANQASTTSVTTATGQSSGTTISGNTSQATLDVTVKPANTLTGTATTAARTRQSPEAANSGTAQTNESNDSDTANFKRQYQNAAEKLTLNDVKIKKLQLTVNRLQASGLSELTNAPATPHNRESLLTKVRVLTKG